MNSNIVHTTSIANLRPVPSYLSQVLKQNPAACALEAAAGFGRWWFDRAKGQIVLSSVAAHYLNVEVLHHANLESCFEHVPASDLVCLTAQISGRFVRAETVDFRVMSETEGIRWLRITRLPDDPASSLLINGILTDITPLKHAAMRESLAFELTEFLAGTHTLDAAVTHVIRLICQSLGWDCGAFWAMQTTPEGDMALHCTSFWKRPELEADLASFATESAKMTVQPGEGLIGSVWQSGHPKWVEEMASDARFPHAADAPQDRLWSGYAFPVTHATAEGRIHSPGVLEFYSREARQPEAQLPRLAATIGAFLAQVAQRIEHEATILHLARVDSLTGLVNRSHFYELLTEECASAAQTQTTFGLAFIDLDRFKPINDAFGHEAGNYVLREFAQRLQSLAPEGAIIGRLGGDEFAMLIPEPAMHGAVLLLEQILQAARTPFVYEGIELTVSASAGVSTWPLCGRTCAGLLQSADAAMYRIKSEGRNGYHFSSITNTHVLVQQQSALARRLTLETDLRHALQGNELFLEYQPIYDIAGQGMQAVEALIRWRRPDGSTVPPELFIPIAEQSHLIAEIGKWVLRQACCDLAVLRKANFTDLKIHVNMAAAEFTNERLTQELLALVRSFELDPQGLVLELTEGMLMKRPDQVIPVMRSLRLAGFGISLDDFGMGHSSLALLKNLPISALKIDRSFVRDLSLKGNDRAIIQTIVDLGSHMDLKVIAEGIETQLQLEIMRQSGCLLIQGYLLAQPMPLQALLKLG
jgi:diguanylate cyclase (GGDEF)-like protein